MIVILQKFTDNDPDTFEPIARGAYFYISDGSAFMHTVGGLPLTGSLQTVLTANEAQHFAEAQANGVLPTAKELSTVEAITWIKANPATKQIFTLTPAALETEVGIVVDALFSGVSAANRNKEKKIRMAQLMAVRVSVAGELEDLGA